MIAEIEDRELATLQEDSGELIDLYSEIVLATCEQLKLVGLQDVEQDYNDANWARAFTFATNADVEQFLRMVQCDHTDWKLDGHTVIIPREDLFKVYGWISLHACMDSMYWASRK